ncbi:MAG TPA: undecaprenyl-phosphate glucose phosphotransferase [Caulobacteraceae bacterium]|nr:undecaprenyl-phosphate glucose phosphotransferase [Caulobacteraceae bacterium]
MSAFDVRDLLKAAGTADAPSDLHEQVLAPAGATGLGPALAMPAHDTMRPRASLSPVVLTGCVRIFECILIGTLAILAHQIEAGGFGAIHVAIAVAIACLAVSVLQAGRAYRIDTFGSLRKTVIKLLAGWFLTIILVAGALALTHIAASGAWLWLANLYVLGLIALAINRAALLLFVRAKTRQGAFDRKTAIVGGGPAAEELINALESSNDGGIQIIGVFDDRSDDRSADSVAGYPKLGNVTDLVAYARNERIDLIVFTLPISAEGRILQMLAKLWVLPIDIRLSAHTTKLRLRPRAYSYLGKVPVLDVFDKPLADWDMIVKGLFDRAVALLAVICLSPVLLGLALAVKLTSRGPALFRQKRYGFNNELIEVYKFRSMYVDQGDAKAAKLVTKDDPRVTPIGRIIRKTSLDELPQLFNVLKGDLSLVGPRPHALEAKAANTLYDQVVDGYFARHKVKPGITGWAQIHGWRGETDTSEKIQRRVEHDLYYIENWSILLDIQILVKTPFALLDTKNAY